MDYSNYEDAFNIGTINLEPRLQEYLRRKKFNEENDIEPPISEEKEFCITPHDIRIIKRYKQGKKKLYTSRRLAQDPHFIKPDQKGFEIIDSQNDFKKDPRYKRLQRKMQSHKDAQKKIRDFEGIDDEYTIFHQTNPYDLKPEKRPQRIAKPYDDPSSMNDYDDSYNDGYSNFQPNDDSIMMDSRDLVLGPARPHHNKTRHDHNRNNASDVDNRAFDEAYANPARGKYCYSPNDKTGRYNTYHHPPKIDYKKLASCDDLTVAGGIQHSRDLNDVIGNLDSYNKHLNNTYDYVVSEADLDTRTFTPGCRTGSLREMPTSYQAIPFRYGNGLPDVCVEDALQGGIRDSKKKSVGFRNPFENQFDYISPEISDYKHSVQMWPQNSRGQNKEIARPNSASARQDREMRDRVVGRK